jgi:hypothetical protein
MKRFLTLIIAACTFQITFSQEGMWLPALLEQNEAQMQKQGFRLTAEDVYAINKTSLKDAVVWFDQGCTGEVISNEGLVLTNHHCGFSAISAASSLEKNYLRDGFWAYAKQQELPAPGLEVTFIISMQDVTDKIVPYLTDITNEQERTAKVNDITKKIISDATAGTHYTAFVRPFYYGNQYYLFLAETFKDIRLVGAPPASVGNFGGETDNWIWPRHTGDFSLFRIYADAENKPAEYSPKNKPYTPRHFFPISLNGVIENDFTMVYGFPGRTQEYLTSYAVDLIVHTTNPNRIACRDIRLAIMHDYMKGNDTVTLLYADKAKSLANAYKKWKGEMTGLIANDAIQKKKDFENQFQSWANAYAGKNTDYSALLAEFEKIYAAYKPYSVMVDYTMEAFYGIEIINFTNNFLELASLLRSDTVSQQQVLNEATDRKAIVAKHFENYYPPLDKKMFASLLQLYADRVEESLQPPVFRQQLIKYQGDYKAYADAVYEKSIFADRKKLEKILNNPTGKNKNILLHDPVLQLCENMRKQYAEIAAQHITPAQTNISSLMRKYMQAQMFMQPDKQFYPDANSTLRVTFGNVKGYSPSDGVFYHFATTDNGIERKYTPGDEEFDVPANLLAMFKANDFGRYADVNGNLPIAFIASNHTTGGNSGSPVLNAKGELIGTNFDRVWEGTMSDIMYDINRCRNISLDIRYTLFIIDKYANAQNIMQELKIAE